MADEQDTGALSAAEQAITEGREAPAAEQPPAEQQQEAAEPQAEAEPEEGETRTPHFVPAGEVAKIRNRAREAEKKAREAEERFQRLAGRLDVLQSAFSRQAPAAEADKAKPLPPLTEAPLDHIEAQRRELDEVKTWRQQQEQQARHAQAREQFLGAIAAQENQYRSAAADYDDAIAYLRSDRAAELAEAGYTPEQAKQIIDGEAMAIADRAFQERRNPAEVWYKMARRRGYKPAAEQGAAKLDTIERGQAASRSLSQAAGNAPAGRMTAQQLVELPEDEFAAIATDPKKWARAMGA